MDIGLIAVSGDPEVLWNCFRLGNLLLEQTDMVTIFLNGPSVSYADLSSERYPILDQARVFTHSDGVLLA